MPTAVCFVSLSNYAVLSGDPAVRHIGGAEVQQAHIARGLAERGHRVSFVTLDHGQPDAVVHDGITVYTAYAPSAGVRAFRFVHPRLTGLWHAMTRADADVYYQRGIDVETGLAAAWCRRKRRKFVFALAHDSNCYYDLPTRCGLHERLLCRYGLRSADAVISQTEFQKDLLKEEYGLSSQVIRSCAVDPWTVGKPFASRRGGSSPRLLWVGRFSREKRLEVLLDLAARMPGVSFDVVGKPNSDSPEARDQETRARGLPNVTLHGYVPNAAMGAHYDQADALLCTSRAEGFPNVFLEAWSRAVPVITTVDPDGLVEQLGLGIVIDPSDGPERRVAAFLADRAALAGCGQKARAHFVAVHGIDRAVDAYERLISAVAEATPALKEPTAAQTHGGPALLPASRRETVELRR